MQECRIKMEMKMILNFQILASLEKVKNKKWEMNDRLLLKGEIIYGVSHFKKWPLLPWRLWFTFFWWYSPLLYKHTHIPICYVNCDLVVASRQKKKPLFLQKNSYFPMLLRFLCKNFYEILINCVLFIFLCSSLLTGREGYLDVIMFKEKKVLTEEMT